MTQLTFDFTATTGFSTSASTYTPNRVASKKPVVRTGQSLSIYNDGRKDLHHIGDLAQAVLERYEIVHRRRAARLARERASMHAK